jgi:hypothetical protein
MHGLVLTTPLNQSRDSSVGMALGYGLDDQGSGVRFPTGAGNFSLHHRVQNGSGPTQPPIQWVSAVLYRGLKLTTHLHLVPRLGMHRAVPPRWSHDSSVIQRWATGWMIGSSNFFLTTASKPAPGGYPASYPMGIRSPFPGVKCAAREADH